MADEITVSKEQQYNSEFTGKQMDAVFRRISNMVTGTATTLPTGATVDGYCIHQIKNVTGRTGINYKPFITVKCHGMGPGQEITATAIYAPTTDMLTVYLFGGGIKANSSRTFNYMLIE